MKCFIYDTLHCTTLKRRTTGNPSSWVRVDNLSLERINAEWISIREMYIIHKGSRKKIRMNTTEICWYNKKKLSKPHEAGEWPLYKANEGSKRILYFRDWNIFARMSFFHYITYKLVIIRDRRIGFIYYTIAAAIVLYTLAEIFIKKGYLEVKYFLFLELMLVSL